MTHPKSDGLTTEQLDVLAGLSRRGLLTGATAVAVLSSAGALLPVSAARAYALPCWDADCPDPSGWASARWSPHAGYYVKGSDLDGANCTNYVAWIMMWRGVAEKDMRGLGNANQWAANAMSRWAVDGTPAVGAVVQWNTSSNMPSGHVAFVEAIRADATLEISESNWTIGGAKRWIDRRVISSAGPSNFIHINDGASPAPIPLEEENMIVFPPCPTNSDDGVIPAGVPFIIDGSNGGALRPLSPAEYSIYASTKGSIPYRECGWNSANSLRQLSLSVGIMQFTMNNGVYRTTGKIVYDSVATADYPKYRAAP